MSVLLHVLFVYSQFWLFVPVLSGCLAAAGSHGGTIPHGFCGHGVLRGGLYCSSLPGGPGTMTSALSSHTCNGISPVEAYSGIGLCGHTVASVPVAMQRHRSEHTVTSVSVAMKWHRAL